MLHIDWVLLICASVVLLIPATLFYPPAGKDRLVHSHNARFRIEQIMSTWQHWLDLIRAFAGTYVLTELAVSYRAVDDVSYFHQDKLLIGGILTAAVLLQTVHFRRFFYFTAPVLFLWGMTLAFASPIPALFAILFSAIIARLGDHVELKLPMMAGLLGVAGYLLDGLSPMLILNCALIVLPMLVAYCSMQNLVCYTRGMAAT